MKLPLVITLVAPDRTGLVESVAQAVASHGGNWLESRMCRLGGEFAGILRIEIPAERKTELLAALQTLPGLNFVVQPARAAEPAAPARQLRLEIVGSDRPGIVREITRALTRANVNVEEFSSERISAPMSGEELFKAAARLQLPEACDVAGLKRDLETIAADLLVDVSIAEVPGA